MTQAHFIILVLLAEPVNSAALHATCYMDINCVPQNSACLYDRCECKKGYYEATSGTCIQVPAGYYPTGTMEYSNSVQSLYDILLVEKKSMQIILRGMKNSNSLSISYDRGSTYKSLYNFGVDYNTKVLGAVASHDMKKIKVYVSTKYSNGQSQYFMCDSDDYGDSFTRWLLTSKPPVPCSGSDDLKYMFGNGFMISIDGGIRWKKLLSAISDEALYSVWVSSNFKNIIGVGPKAGVVISTNYGQSFTAYDKINGKKLHIANILYCPELTYVQATDDLSEIVIGLSKQKDNPNNVNPVPRASLIRTTDYAKGV